jgi:hypothetical protein
MHQREIRDITDVDEEVVQWVREAASLSKG